MKISSLLVSKPHKYEKLNCLRETKKAFKKLNLYVQKNVFLRGIDTPTKIASFKRRSRGNWKQSQYSQHHQSQKKKYLKTYAISFFFNGSPGKFAFWWSPSGRDKSHNMLPVTLAYLQYQQMHICLIKNSKNQKLGSIQGIAVLQRKSP